MASLSLLCGMAQLSDAQQYLPNPKKNEVSIGNTKISRDNKDLVVDYQIQLGTNVLSCVVEVILEVDGRPVKNFSSADLAGDFGKITKSGQKQIRFNVERMKRTLADRQISFTLNVKKKDVLDDKILAMGSISVFPQMSYGAMLGYVKKFGGYVKFRSDFNSVSPAYNCTSDGKMDNGVFWASGLQKKTRMQATAGMLFRLSGSVYPYVGAGYGSRGVYWEDSGNSWAKVTDYSCTGVAAEAGMIFRMGPVAVSAGVSTTSFKYIEAEVGIGVMF